MDLRGVGGQAAATDGPSSTDVATTPSPSAGGAAAVCSPSVVMFSRSSLSLICMDMVLRC